MSREHFVNTPHGQVFAREWLPPSSADGLQKAPIVLLHDSLGSVDLWRSFPAVLAEATHRRVIAYDRLGFGRSDARHDRLTPAFVEQESHTAFAAVHEHLVGAAFVVMGHSVGGGMAVHIAAHYASRCLALITESAQAFAEDLTLRSIAQAQETFQDPQQRERLARYHGDKADWVLQAWTGTWLSEAFSTWTLKDVLPQVRCPTLVMHGEFDEYGSACHPAMIAARVSGPAQHVLLAGAHHVPHREDEAGIAQRVQQFLQSVA